MNCFSIISTDGAPFEGITRYGIRCTSTECIVEINDISENKKLVAAIAGLASAANITASELYDFVSRIIGIVV